MEKRVIEKNKYIIYNEDRKILTFTPIIEHGIKHIAIPSSVVKGYDVNSTGKFYQDVKKQVLDEEDLCFLKQVAYEVGTYKCENRKLKKQTLRMVRNYYSFYKEFTSEDYRAIMELCYEHGVLPEFLSIEEIISCLRCTKNKKIDIDKNLMQPLEELQKRLDFKIY